VGRLIDTNVLVEFERHPDNYPEFLKDLTTEKISLSVISASELLHGIHRATDAAVRLRREAFVEGILSILHVIEVDLLIARQHAQIWAELSKSGSMISHPDLWIAATCLVHNLSLLTFNRRDFERIPGFQFATVTKI
jgi:tRNA(fMet)-specific endonuclease VapC